MFSRALLRHAAPVTRALALPTASVPFARALATAPRLLDVTESIKLDHDNVRELFTRFKAASSRDEKGVIANTLIREMAIHGDAEEISVYNAMNEIGLTDATEHNKEDHAEVKRLVYDADIPRLSNPDYDSVMEKAVSAFLAHAEEEESDQFSLIRSKLSAEQNDKAARDFLKARTQVPTRPHPWAPQTGGLAQKAAGVQGGIHDKVVETLGRRDFVDLKYEHPKDF